MTTELPPTELEQKAAEAWALMTRVPTILDALIDREPMPVGAALDYVQEVTGDRDDAVMALLAAGAKAVMTTVPADMVGLEHEAVAFACHLRGECFGLASSNLETIYQLSQHTFHDLQRGLWNNVPDRPSSFNCEHWRRWAKQGMVVLNWCRKVVAAAYPADPVDQPD